MTPRRIRYRLGARLLRPLAREMQAAMDQTPPVEVPDPPPVGAPDTFRERQEWARKITERDALTMRIRWEKNAIGNLILLAGSWPHAGWQQVIHDRLRRMPTLHPFSSVYDVGHLERAAERIAGLEDRNRGLTDLVRRVYQHFIDIMPGDLADEIGTNLGMERRSMLTTTITDVSDEGWEAP